MRISEHIKASLFSKRNVFVVGIILVSIILRVVLLKVADRQLHWDSSWYNQSAIDVLYGKFIAHCCTHGPGYPLFIALIYKLFGLANTEALLNIQFIMDIFVAFLIGLTSWSLFGKKIGFLSFALYLFNPFTSSYTGIVMTEVLSFVLISILAFFASHHSKNNFFWWFLNGLLLGILFLTKPVFFWFCVLYILFLIIKYNFSVRRLFYSLLVCIGFFLPTFYMVKANNATFGKFSIFPPYQATSWGMYLSLYSGYTPELLSEFTFGNDEWVRANQQYYYWLMNDKSQIQVYEKKYKQLLYEKVKNDWRNVVQTIGKNLLLLWDKRHLSIYLDPFYPNDKLFLRLLNIIYFIFGFVGVGSIIKTKLKKHHVFLVYTLLLFLYITFLFPLVTNLSRHSLPFYPVLFIWAGQGLWVVWHLLRHRLYKVDDS